MSSLLTIGVKWSNPASNSSSGMIIFPLAIAVFITSSIILKRRMVKLSLLPAIGVFHPGNVNSISGKHSKPDSDNPPTAKETFIGYLQIAMRHTKEEREVMFPSATYPFLSTKFDFVTNYLKKYNIDLEAIAKGPEDWDIKPYPELPKTDEGDGDDDDPWGDWGDW